MVCVCMMQRYDVPISKDLVERVMAAADSAIVELLLTVYDYVHEDPAAQAPPQDDLQYPEYFDPNAVSAPTSAAEAYQGADFSPNALPTFLPPGSLPYVQQPHPDAATAAYDVQQPVSSSFAKASLPQQGTTSGWPPGPVGPTHYAMPAQQLAYSQQAYAEASPYSQQSSYAQQPVGMYSAQPYPMGMQQHMQAANTAMPHHMTPHTVLFAAQQQPFEAGQGAEASMPSIEFDRRPRVTEYKPYTQQDYSSRNYDAKRQDYWKLGTLGPQIEDEDLQVTWSCLKTSAHLHSYQIVRSTDAWIL